jgi:small basic protein
MIISDKSARYGLTVPVMLGVMGGLLGLMAYFMDRMDRAEDIYGADSFRRYLPLAVYSTLPSVAGALCDYLAVILNNYEGHEVQVGAILINDNCR